MYTMMKKYGIKEVSEIMDIPSSTLRYYEKTGVIDDVERDKNGLRLYDETQLKRLMGIKCFKETGLPIAKIFEFYQYEDNLETHIDDIISLIEGHERELTARIERMQEQLQHIRHKVRFYHGIQDAIENGREWPDFKDFACPAAGSAFESFAPERCKAGIQEHPERDGERLPPPPERLREAFPV